MLKVVLLLNSDDRIWVLIDSSPQLVWCWVNLLGMQHGTLMLLMDKHLCYTRTMANFRYSLPSSVGASAAYHGISVKCNSNSTNPPTEFLPRPSYTWFCFRGFYKSQLDSKAKNPKIYEHDIFFSLSSLFFLGKNASFNCCQKTPVPLCQPTGGKKAMHPFDANFWRGAIRAAEWSLQLAHPRSR